MDAVIIPIVQMKKLRLRETRKHRPAHIISNCRKWNSTQVCLTPESTLLPTCYILCPHGYLFLAPPPLK